MSEKEELTQNIEKTQARLDRAAKLTTGLADEQIRWAETVTVRYMQSVYKFIHIRVHAVEHLYIGHTLSRKCHEWRCIGRKVVFRTAKVSC